MSTEVIKNKAKKAACLAGVAAAIVFLGVDGTIQQMVISPVAGILPTAFIEPVAVGTVVFATSMIFDVFLKGDSWSSM